MVKAADFSEAIAERRYLLPPYPAVHFETHITNLIADFRDAKDPAHLGAGQALYAEYGPGYATTHAHPVDQWQVYLKGDGKLAKKPVKLVTVQYSDAWVPYGPIDVGDRGFSLLALWPRPNDETYEMAKDAERIKRSLRDRPRRILFAEVDVTDGDVEHASEATLLDEGPVWARRWRLPASAALATPPAADGGGQFFVPLAGSVAHGGHEYGKWSAIWVGSADAPIELRAGAAGADVLGMQFAPQG